MIPNGEDLVTLRDPVLPYCLVSTSHAQDFHVHRTCIATREPRILVVLYPACF